MTDVVIKLKRTLTLSVTPEDDSQLQLAAMVLALRDSHVQLMAEITCRPIHEIESMIDEAYDQYLESFLQQMVERQAAHS